MDQLKPLIGCEEALDDDEKLIGESDEKIREYFEHRNTLFQLDETTRNLLKGFSENIIKNLDENLNKIRFFLSMINMIDYLI